MGCINCILPQCHVSAKFHLKKWSAIGDKNRIFCVFIFKNSPDTVTGDIQLLLEVVIQSVVESQLYDIILFYGKCTRIGAKIPPSQWYRQTSWTIHKVHFCLLYKIIRFYYFGKSILFYPFCLNLYEHEHEHKYM